MPKQHGHRHAPSPNNLRIHRTFMGRVALPARAWRPLARRDLPGVADVIMSPPASMTGLGNQGRNSVATIWRTRSLSSVVPWAVKNRWCTDPTMLKASTLMSMSLGTRSNFCSEAR
jgi:hypothetical protein